MRKRCQINKIFFLIFNFKKIVHITHVARDGACTALGGVKWEGSSANFDAQLITGLAFIGTAFVARGCRICMDRMLSRR